VSEKKCPLLGKYYVDESEEMPDWAKEICLSCIISPVCIYDLPGSWIPLILKERLNNTNIPCPKCHTDPIVWREVMGGIRPSTLCKNADGDWQCYLCGFIIYQQPIRKRKKK